MNIDQCSCVDHVTNQYPSCPTYNYVLETSISEFRICAQPSTKDSATYSFILDDLHEAVLAVHYSVRSVQSAI